MCAKNCPGRYWLVQGGMPWRAAVQGYKLQSTEMRRRCVRTAQNIEDSRFILRLSQRPPEKGGLDRHVSSATHRQGEDKTWRHIDENEDRGRTDENPTAQTRGAQMVASTESTDVR